MSAIGLLLYKPLQSAPVCGAELRALMDLETEYLMEDTSLESAGNTINITARLTVNHRFIVIFEAINAAGSANNSEIISKYSIGYTEQLHVLYSNNTPIIPVGSHDIANATARESGEDQVNVQTEYFKYPTASGALYGLIFITDIGAVDLKRSDFLAFDRNISHNHTLPFNLSPRRYSVIVYDIEANGTLLSGIGYPAVIDELLILENSHGTRCMCIIIIYHY